VLKILTMGATKRLWERMQEQRFANCTSELTQCYNCGEWMENITDGMCDNCHQYMNAQRPFK